ncbi:hypothetical protein [Paenibacillus sp.]|uniref:hypothetical protein n=1 Tax=Paenibacillus sp. TaxID=58172 RepID=UPI002D688DF3|nr:hypothetical protein [Paenibacillus sp.]HZG83864.1 hypothetical protein [Paenibacillus sp.]
MSIASLHTKEDQQRALMILLKRADRCDLDTPSGVARKIELLSEAQVIIGRFAANAVRDYNRVYAERKRVHAEAFLAAKRDKAHHAELAVVELRLKEAELEAEKVRWNNAFASNLEVINSLKYTHKVLMAEMLNPQNGS